jgi:hypothetical protein
MPLDVWQRLWFLDNGAPEGYGKYQAVVKRDIASNVDWAWRVNCMASSVAVSNYFPWGRLNNHSYVLRPKTIENLVAKFQATMSTIVDMLRRK